MKLLIFSDIHGNLPALETMLKDAGRVDGYICLGDVVDYGPWSNECIDLISSLPNMIALRGNHEDDFLSGHYRGSNPIARLFFDFCYPTFTRRGRLETLPETYELNGFIFRHTINRQNIYPDTNIALDHNYVIGHSHHQFKLEQPPFTLINTGSVGQNRKFINVINYVTLDTAIMRFDLKSKKYNERLIIDEMVSKHYPRECIEYYDNKERAV